MAAFFGALLLCTCALAQGGGWAAVQGVSPGSRIEVRLTPPKAVNVKGVLVSVSGTGLDVQNSNGSVRHVARARIAKVYLVGKAHKLRDGLIGAAAGGATGAVLGYAVAFDGYDYNGHTGLPYHEDNRAAGAAVGALAIGTVGAAIGAVIGLRHKKTLVYRRESGPHHWRARAFAARHDDSATHRT